MTNKYLDFAKGIAKEAGGIIKANFHLGMKKTWKKDDTPLTLTDTTINDLVIKEIEKKFPHHSVLGEEKQMMKNSDYVWVCDPVDGTIPFSHGIPTFMFSLALVYKGEPIIGVLFDPILKRFYSAAKDEGAFLNGKRINVSHALSFKNQMINLDADFSNFFGDFQKKMFKDNIFVSVLYCATYGASLVANGELIGEIYAFNHPWDAAASKIIVEEAGGKTTDLNGNSQRYDEDIKGFVATNGYLHEKILTIISQSKSS